VHGACRLLNTQPAPPTPRGEMMQFFFPQMIDQDSNPLVPMLASVGTQVV
jgi:hypothetical protein